MLREEALFDTHRGVFRKRALGGFTEPLDADFDDDCGYFDRVKAEIQASGSFRAGIDVLPSFCNDLLSYQHVHTEEPKRRWAAPAKHQIAWEQERARRRALDDAEMEREWERAERRVLIAKLTPSDLPLLAQNVFVINHLMPKTTEELRRLASLMDDPSSKGSGK